MTAETVAVVFIVCIAASEIIPYAWGRYLTHKERMREMEVGKSSGGQEEKL